MKNYEFNEGELSTTAFEVYSNSSFTFYKHRNTFFVSMNRKEAPQEIGNIQDVNEFLEGFAE